MDIGNDNHQVEIVGSRHAFTVSVALLVMGSAISLLSCGGPVKPPGEDDEKIVSRTVRNMETVTSENGKKDQRIRSALVEEHAFARPSYTEHRFGIEVTGYDSLGRNPASRIEADHAIHWTERDMWQLNGNVFVEGEGDERLYTQQLFWDKKTKKIWSNVDCKFERGSEVFIGVGFDALDDFSYAAVRNLTGMFSVDVDPDPAGSSSEPSSGESAGTLSASPPVDSLTSAR